MRRNEFVPFASNANFVSRKTRKEGKNKRDVRPLLSPLCLASLSLSELWCQARCHRNEVNEIDDQKKYRSPLSLSLLHSWVSHSLFPLSLRCMSTAWHDLLVLSGIWHPFLAISNHVILGEQIVLGSMTTMYIYTYMYVYMYIYMYIWIWKREQIRTRIKTLHSRRSLKRKT